MKTILLVEDTRHLAEEISDMLRMENFQVVMANSGGQAIDVIQPIKPDLVITDLLMPGIDGFELIKRIRQMDVGKSIPIIILSAKASAPEKARGIEAGANAFIVKPCKSHELLQVITRLLAAGDL